MRSLSPEPAPLPASQEGLEFLQHLLLEQQTLRTPVALFSAAHDQHSVRERFSHLIPLSRPTEGEQYAFEVNLDACTGCKACVSACHSLNGLDDQESWRDMGMLVGTRAQPYQQTVTTACHHCVDPACANGCPVLAYDKDAVTGIVRHLDDQCIGCSYCLLKCPYDVPKLNFRRGIVRKCDMCQGRLAEGEAPACVQACPNEAIQIKVVRQHDVPDHGAVVPGAFDSSYTRPTTTYLSSRPIPAEAQPADAGRLRLDHAHPPLTWMLLLTQMSAGTFLILAVAAWQLDLPRHAFGLACLIVLGVGLLGIGLSVLHLGQPLKAWRAFLGWRKSWLSREIIAFGLFAKLGLLTQAAWWVEDASLQLAAVHLAAGGGLLAVFSSVMVYVDTRRPFWSMPLTSARFFGTTLLLGTALSAAIAACWQWPAARMLMTLSLVLAGLQTWAEHHLIHRAAGHESHPWHGSARILRELLPAWGCWRRLLCLGAGLVSLPAFFMPSWSPSLFSLSTLLLLAHQWMERHTFFTAARGPKMPGH